MKRKVVCMISKWNVINLSQTIMEWNWVSAMLAHGTRAWTHTSFPCDIDWSDLPSWVKKTEIQKEYYGIVWAIRSIWIITIGWCYRWWIIGACPIKELKLSFYRVCTITLLRPKHYNVIIAYQCYGTEHTCSFLYHKRAIGSFHSWKNAWSLW